MEQESELKRLEKFVEKILTRFSALKDEKTQLDQELFERDLLIEELKDNISSKVTERNEISERVNKIVDQIEQWELNLESDEQSTNDGVSTTAELDEADSSSNLQKLEERNDEEKRRTQQNLFSSAESGE